MSASVQSRMGAVAWEPLAITPFPIPAHQTGRADFRHPAFRLASPQGTRRLTVHLLVSGDDTSARDGLRRAVELSLKAPDLIRRCQAHHQSPTPHHLQKRTRSRVPLLHRHYPASTLLLPRPTPAVTTA